MIIVGKSQAALAMICDAIASWHRHHIYYLEILNNLNIDGTFKYKDFYIREIQELKRFDTVVLGAVMPDTKKSLFEAFSHLDITFDGAINSTAYISKNAHVSGSCLIDAHASISSGAVLDSFVTIYSNASIAHDAELEKYVTVCPNASVCGNVKIGEGSFIGAGAVIKQGIKIGAHCNIGAGSVVLKDVENGQTVYGVPAKPKMIMAE